MRALLLLVVLAVPAHADGTDWPTGQRLQIHDTDQPDDPPMPVFATRTSLYLMRLGDDGAPRCEEWTTRPGTSKDPNHGKLVHDKDSVDYHSSGIRLEACGYRALVHEEAGGNELDVDGARWFRDPQKCASGIAKHRAVATDFHACLAKPPPAKAVDAARARLRAVFGKAGTLWVRDGSDCRVARASFDAALGTGTLVIDGDRYPTTYHFDAGSDAVLDVDGDGAPAELGDGTITALGTTFYTAEAGCRNVIAIDQRRASWLPNPP